eukprot:2072996-Rhodomonas_salina.2
MSSSLRSRARSSSWYHTNRCQYQACPSSTADSTRLGVAGSTADSRAGTLSATGCGVRCAVWR